MSKAQNIVITGASKGIGYELVQVLLKRGHHVIAVSRSVERLNQLANDNDSLEVLQLDITKNLAKLVNQLTIVHHLINNAGYLINKPIQELTDTDILDQFNVNAIAPLRLTREMLPYFAKGASICNISSMGGVQGSAKFPGLAAYSSSKGALSILTECLAEELKDNQVRCNALALGAVQTEMLKQAFPDYQAPFTPNQMAIYIADFVLESSKFYNGKILPVSSSTP